MDVSGSSSDDIGTIKMHHTFNGAAPLGRGWMICNGNVINQTNYDAIHGSGRYVRDQVASGPLAGKTLPNMVNNYPVGVAATTQTGSGTITSVGNVGHVIDISHNHQWYESNAPSTDQSFDSSGNPISIGGTGQAGTHLDVKFASDQGPNADMYTTIAGSSAKNIQPESIQLIFKIRVI
jgi:hypothetical protein